MHRASSGAVCAFTIVGLVLAGGCGGGGTDVPPQVPTGIKITPTSVAFGAIGSTRQLSAVVVDANGAAVAGAAAPTWARAGNGATASVSASGLVTAVGVGATDTAVATASGFSAKAPISVTQVVVSVTVSSTGSDTLTTVGSTKTYTAAATDSNNNAIGSATLTWSSSATGVATVNSGTGVATAVDDGNTNVTATASNGVNGSKALVVQRVVATVAITQPANPPSFATLGRTVQFAAVAKDAGGATLSNATITWSSTSPSVATVSGSGLVMAAGNGTTSITASAGAQTSPGTTVTVQQVAASVVITPASVAFGAIGSTRQLAAAVKDSGGANVVGAPAVTWSRAGTGATASVGAGGLVTSVGVGATDSAVASASSLSAKAPISVTQVVVTVTVSSTGSDTLKTTTRTKQYTAVAKDSNANAIGSATFAWGSSATGVATVVGGTGLATAVSDGSTTITATSGSKSGTKTLVVRRYAATFTLSLNTPQTITTNAGTLMFTGTAQDSALTNLTITWTSDNTAVLTMSPGTGTSSTATGKGNGSANVTMAGGTLSSMVAVTVSGQATAPMTASVTVGDDFFTSVHNSTINPAVDTIAAGGTVTWTWGTSFNAHSVQSTATPSFTSSTTLQGAGKSYQFTFASPGTYTYDCVVHGTAMTGRIVVQ
jgi:plastocyanin